MTREKEGHSLPWAEDSMKHYDSSPFSSLMPVILDDRTIADLYQIATGAYAPLTGFLEEADYLLVCSDMHLTSGAPWPIPITLAVDEDVARHLHLDQEIVLIDSHHLIRGRMTVTSIYRPNLRREAKWVYHTTDISHPGVRYLLSRKPVYIGGPVSVDHIPELAYASLIWRPSDVRRAISERGFKRVVGFQTRNPIHRAHEYIQKTALETLDGLLIHPLVGPTKDDDIPPAVRIKTYQRVIDKWYRKDRVLLAAYTGAMRYAGPKEAVLHAIVRRNYGCTHFIVGRDHGGVGQFYGPYDAHHIFDQFRPGELGIIPLLFDDAFYCRQCQGMTSAKVCPHDESYWVRLSGSEVRRRLKEGEPIPEEFMRKDVSEILYHYYHFKRQGL
ncbi:sulfate adenylyltransferase [Sulfobacillus thermosulfidooxidans]|uniref:sulfate adenylyltransferase n=1 Tax=Sulfobacillus thermosulfidooxidans TaxID=28034 RepID=UPI0002EC3161|nr:sulfate adenylyltransferase [Sulfobacillus thermosulfidooxidans]